LDKYQLSKKECRTDEANWCTSGSACDVDTSGQHPDKFCCCSEDLCNQNVTFSHPENVDMMSECGRRG
jgi:hypothetical protein